MSDCTIEQALLRINGSDPSSPIAVFSSDEPGKVDAVFASTIMTQKMIRRRHSGFIGVYSGAMDIDCVQRELEKHLAIA
jgi:hypothetical protein